MSHGTEIDNAEPRSSVRRVADRRFTLDIERLSQAKAKRTRRIIYIVTGLAAITLVTAGLSRLKPAAPGVDRATVWVDTVKRGPLVRQVRGTGTLVPEEVRWIPAGTEGRIERVLVQPGAIVMADTVLLEMSNPELELSARDAEWQVRGAEAELAKLKISLESQLLDQKAEAARVQADFHQARLQAEADEALAKDGLVSSLSLKVSRVRAQELSTRQELEQKRLEIAADSAEAELAVQRSRLEQVRALAALRRSQLEALRVRPGVEGVLQQLPVEVGQRVSAGVTLAKVVQPGRLKAELRIAETQAKDILIGQPATIDTRNGIVAGRVSRIDPAVENGTVTVDVQLTEALPKGARPDLSVDGAIELERLADVLYVGRPAYGQENSLVGLFRIESDGAEASRVQVRLGRSSVNTIEIVEGLAAGDQVVLSDVSAWDAFDRIRLN